MLSFSQTKLFKTFVLVSVFVLCCKRASVTGFVNCALLHSKIVCD